LRPDKDTYFLRHAVIASQMSTCKRRSVGCVLINERRKILGIGYNGVPSGMPHCNEGHPCPGADAPSGTNLSECFATHAEVNAVIQCRDPYAIDTVYTTTAPCVDCTKFLMNTSAKRIVFIEAYPHSESKKLWEQVGRLWIHAKDGVDGCWITNCDECGGLGMRPIDGGMSGWEVCDCPNGKRPRTVGPAAVLIPKTSTTYVELTQKKKPDPNCPRCGGRGEVSVGGGCMGYEDEPCKCIK
jgi:dCMP deaminase